MGYGQCSCSETKKKQTKKVGEIMLNMPLRLGSGGVGGAGGEFLSVLHTLSQVLE